MAGIRKVILDTYFSFLREDVEKGRYVVVPEARYMRSGPQKQAIANALRKARKFPTFILTPDGDLVFVLNDEYAVKTIAELRKRGFVLDLEQLASILRAWRYRRHFRNVSSEQKWAHFNFWVHEVPEDNKKMVNRSKSVVVLQ